MAITALDPKSALVVIDLQKGIVAYPTAHPIADVVGQAAALATAFRKHGLPVVLVNVTGRPAGRAEQSRTLPTAAEWADLVPELNRQPSDHLVTKKTPGAFTDTDLEQYFKQSGVTQIVLAGVATSNGVEATARHAFELGFNVALALDAMTDMNADAHINSITRIFPRLGEIDTTARIVELLELRSL